MAGEPLSLFGWLSAVAERRARHSRMLVSRHHLDSVWGVRVATQVTRDGFSILYPEKLSKREARRGAYGGRGRRLQRRPTSTILID